ncbi:MAG: VOC family protein [Solirubrobacterales bacterium]
MSSAESFVTGVDFVSIPTDDLDAARAFYTDVLGLEPSNVWQRPDDENAMGAEFETGTVTIALLNCKALGLEFKPHTAPIALQVDDVAAVRGQLEKRGIEFRGEIIDSGVCHQTFFADPDGNAIGLHHRYAQRD